MPIYSSPVHQSLSFAPSFTLLSLPPRFSLSAPSLPSPPLSFIPQTLSPLIPSLSLFLCVCVYLKVSVKMSSAKSVDSSAMDTSTRAYISIYTTLPYNTLANPAGGGGAGASRTFEREGSNLLSLHARGAALGPMLKSPHIYSGPRQLWAQCWKAHIVGQSGGGGGGGGGSRPQDPPPLKIPGPPIRYTVWWPCMM